MGEGIRGIRVMEDILLHTCCGPCATYTTEHLAAEGFVPLMYYYNPNIHPYREWQKRRETLEDFAEKKGLALLVEDEYDLSGFLQSFSSIRCYIHPSGFITVCSPVYVL